MVSAHSARQKKDIYGKPFVHSFFAVAGHFVAAGGLVLLSSASGMSQGEWFRLVCGPLRLSG